MLYRLAGDTVVALHRAFVAFAALGGMLASRRLAYAGFTCRTLAWAGSSNSAICPLTPLENRLRVRAGETGYPGSFAEHYLMPVLYPAGLTPDAQKWIGAALVALNVAIYAVALARARSRKGER